jgi:hypothetical protein
VSRFTPRPAILIPATTNSHRLDSLDIKRLELNFDGLV